MAQFRIASALVAASLLLTACSGGSHSMLPPARSAASKGVGNGVAAPVANPANLNFTALGSANAQTFTVTVQFDGDLSAVSSDTGVATVTPSTASPTVTPTGGSTKSATFTVTPTGNGTATITVTDKKGGTTTVAVVVSSTPEPSGEVATFFGRDGATTPANQGIIYVFKPGNFGTPDAILTLPRNDDSSDWDFQGRLTFDPNGNLWVAYTYSDPSTSNTATVAEYTAPLSTNEVPSRIIAGPNTGLQVPFSIDYSATLNQIIVGDVAHASLSFFPASASGNVAPIRTISGPQTELHAPYKIASDASSIYVAQGANGGTGISVFPLNASGDTAPSLVLPLHNAYARSAAIGSFSYDVSGHLLAVYQGQSPGTIQEYLATPDAVDPTASLTAPSCSDVGTDDNGFLYVADRPNGSVDIYGPYTTSSIPSAPFRQIMLGAGGWNYSLAVYSPESAAAAIPK
jgi:hypothetical protein